MQILRLVVCLGAVHKRRPQSGGCPVRTRREGCSSDADVRTFWSKKLRFFFEIYGVSARTREGWANSDKREGINLSRFCADVFYEQPLSISVSAPQLENIPWWDKNF